MFPNYLARKRMRLQRRRMAIFQNFTNFLRQARRRAETQLPGGLVAAAGAPPTKSTGESSMRLSACTRRAAAPPAAPLSSSYSKFPKLDFYIFEFPNPQISKFPATLEVLKCPNVHCKMIPAFSRKIQSENYPLLSQNQP